MARDQSIGVRVMFWVLMIAAAGVTAIAAVVLDIAIFWAHDSRCGDVPDPGMVRQGRVLLMLVLALALVAIAPAVFHVISGMSNSEWEARIFCM